jgi:DHA1 family multidrug resistance protein-like MFS transporter
MQTWQRNLYAIWVAEMVSTIGFTVIQPFMPYYIRELGVTSLTQVELYAGLSLSLHAGAMVFTAPIWGSLADRYGRKIMVERAILATAFFFALIGFVHDVPSLLVLRTLQGCFAGVTAAALTLVACSTPRDRVGYALGSLQVANYLGALLGPLLGGFVADMWGYRAPFFVTGALMTLGAVPVLAMVKENFQPVTTKEQEGSFWYGLRQVLASRVLFSVFVVAIFLRLGERVLLPILPLFVASLLPLGAAAATVTGLILGVRAATSALGAFVLGRASDRAGHHLVLLFCAFGAAVLYLPQAFVVNATQLLILQTMLGFMLGGTLTTVSAMLSRLSPEGRQGAAYGVYASARSLAATLGPMLGVSVAAGFGLRSSFLFAAGIFGLAAFVVVRLVGHLSRP